MVQLRIQGFGENKHPAGEIQQIQETYQLGLKRFAHAIRDVEVSFVDVNGPRGGIDKLCRVQLRLYPRGVLTVKTEEKSFTQAARIACAKIKVLLSKRISKRKCVQTR